jgi:small redox-active disulfide protein 2
MVQSLLDQTNTQGKETTMKKIQILGTGCAKCNALAENAKEAAVVLGEEVEIEKVTDIKVFANYGCMSTPGLVINGNLVSQGKLLKPDQIMKLIRPIPTEF